MSDSLRDQLLQAGFKQPAKEPAKSSKPGGKKNRGKAKSATQRPSSAKVPIQAEAEAQARKAAKAKIKSLIEDAEIKDFAGEEVYRFTLQNRIRELHLKPDVRTKLVDGSLSVTRLNGTTRVVPTIIIEKIQEINPNWAIVKPSSAEPDSEDGYDDYQVPDELVW